MKPVALITGASAGIGSIFARQLAARGCDLILVARRTDRLEALAAELKGTHCEILAADLSLDADVARVCARIAALPQLDYLINNAGFGSKGRFIEDLETQVNMHRVHVLATVQLTHAALKGMVARKSGAIVNVASVASFTLSATGTSYSATKHWMKTFSEGLYLELRTTGSPVKVQALCPGFTYSEFHDVIQADRSAIPKSLWLDPNFVVGESLKGVDEGKLFVIPDWRYRWLCRLVPLIPSPLLYWSFIRASKRFRR